MRHPGTPEARKRIDARAEGTLDQVVRRSLAAAAECERSARIAGASKDSLGQARLSNAAAALGRLAVQALKARSLVGDILPRPKAQTKDAPLMPGPDGAQQGRDLRSWFPAREDA